MHKVFTNREKNLPEDPNETLRTFNDIIIKACKRCGESKSMELKRARSFRPF